MNIRGTDSHFGTGLWRCTCQLAKQRSDTGPGSVHLPVTYNQKLAHLSLPAKKAVAILTKIAPGDKEDPWAPAGMTT